MHDSALLPPAKMVGHGTSCADVQLHACMNGPHIWNMRCALLFSCWAYSWVSLPPPSSQLPVSAVYSGQHTACLLE